MCFEFHIYLYSHNCWHFGAIGFRCSRLLKDNRCRVHPSYFLLLLPRTLCFNTVLFRLLLVVDSLYRILFKAFDGPNLHPVRGGLLCGRETPKETDTVLVVDYGNLIKDLVDLFIDALPT